MASRRNTPASRFFFSSFFLDTHARTRRLMLPSSERPFFLYARRTSGGERSAGSQRGEDDDDDDDDDLPESSGSSGRAGCNIRRLPRRGGRRIIQNYLVFSLSSSSFSSSASSFFFLLSPLALGSVSCAARNSVQAWRGLQNKQEKNNLLHHLHPKSYPWIFDFYAQSQIRPLPIESRAPLSSVRVPAGDSYTLHGSFFLGGKRCRCKTGK